MIKRSERRGWHARSKKGSFSMLCLSFDIAKGKSVAGLFNREMKPLIAPHEIHHERAAFEALASKLDAGNTEIILESTSLYHYPVTTFFERLGYPVITVNPIVTSEHKRNLRKTKTDRIDCINLASIYFENKYNLQKRHLPIYHQMQSVSRHIFTLNEGMVRYKNRYHQLLELIFPLYEYELKARDKFRIDHMTLLCAFPHPELIARASIKNLLSAYASVHRRMDGRFLITLRRIKELSSSTLSCVDRDDVIVSKFVELSRLIIDLELKIARHKERLIEMAKPIRDFDHIASIPGISPYMAALLVAELKDIASYPTIKQLTAACGLDPTIVQSGRSVDYRGHISKRGNKHARKALFNAVINILLVASRSKSDHPILLYYRKKRSENKHHYASVIACTTKLLRIIFTLCKNDLNYTYTSDHSHVVTPIV